MDDRERLEQIVNESAEATRMGRLRHLVDKAEDIARRALDRVDELEALPSVAGRMVTGTLADLMRRAQRFLADEQDKPMPDNALIGVLCDTVRLVREHVDAQKRPPLEPRAEKAKAELDACETELRIKGEALDVARAEVERLRAAIAANRDTLLRNPKQGKAVAVRLHDALRGTEEET